jgi:hypothetical protein
MHKFMKHKCVFLCEVAKIAHKRHKFMKYKCVFSFWEEVVEKFYAFGTHKMVGVANRSMPSARLGVCATFALHLNFLHGIAVIARPKLGR